MFWYTIDLVHVSLALVTVNSETILHTEFFKVKVTKDFWVSKEGLSEFELMTDFDSFNVFDPHFFNFQSISTIKWLQS